MKLYFVSIFLLCITYSMSYAQGVFVSAGSGNWNSNTWTLIAGTDANNRPDADDDVTILPGHTITANRDEECNDLTLSGGTLAYSGNRTVTVNGNLSVTANSAVTGFSATQFFVVDGNATINSGVSLSIPSITLSIAGSTTVNGTMTIAGNSRTRTFGNVTINSGGSFVLTGGNTYNFNGDLTNNGTFTANSFNQLFNFNSSSGTISGSNEINIFQATFNSPSNYTNIGDLIIRNNLSGTGTFINGMNGQLELQNAGPFTMGTFNGSATNNTVTYTGFGNPTGFNGSYYNLVINKSSGNLTFSGTPSILNDLTIQNGIFQVTAVTVSIGNDLNLEGGEFTPDNASAVVNIGGNLNISGGQYDHNNGDVNVTGDIVVTGGDFFLNGASSTIDAGSVSLQGVSLTLSQGTWTTTGDYDLEAGSSLTGNGAAINIGGTFNFNSDATANFTGGTLSASSIYVGSGNELFVNAVNLSSTGVAELDGTITFNNSSGTKSVGSVLVNATGNWNVTQPLNITISGDITNNGTFTGDPGYGTSTYTLTSNSGTIDGSNPIAIRDVLINSPGSYTNLGDLTVASSMRGTGSFINGSNATFTYRGNNSSGTNFDITNFTADALDNTVIYAGLTYNQIWRTTTNPNNDYYNVQVNFNTGGYQRLTLVADVRVNGTLTIIEGSPLLNSFDLEMAAGSTIAGGSPTSYIRINSTGIVRQYYSAVGGTTSYPIGDNTNFSPITSLTINSATLGVNPFLEIDVTDAVHPNRNTDNTGLGGDDEGIAAVDYISRYWTLTGNDIGNPRFDVSYQYIDGDITGTESNMIAALYRQPIGETFFDWYETGTINAVNNTATVHSADNWGDLYAMDNNLERLPIELILFELEKQEQSVKVIWKTASETNNDYFTLERSADGIRFEEIAKISGAGNSIETQNYIYIDNNPVSGRSYYRLKQTDLDGSFDYSELLSVVFEASRKKHSFSVYPSFTESGQDVYLSLGDFQGSGSTLEYKIINQSGIAVHQNEITDSETENVKLPFLPSGLYFIQIQFEGSRSIKRLIVR